MPRASTNDKDFCLRQAARCRRQAQEQTDLGLKLELLFYATELEQRALRLSVIQYYP